MRFQRLGTVLGRERIFRGLSWQSHEALFTVDRIKRGMARTSLPAFYIDGRKGKTMHRLRIAIPIPPEDRYPNYFAALETLGAVGVRVSPETDAAEFDGLLLPGGDDIDPSVYGQEPAGAVDPDPVLDALQLPVVDRFFRAGKTIFGICRGHELLNVYFGGTLIQDLPGKTHVWEETRGGDRVHPVISEPDSWAGALYGERFDVNSAHHQAVDRIGRGLTVDLRAPDGVVEALHHESGRVFSVQWHPERMCFAHRRDDTVDGSVVLKWFLQRCAAGRDE